jgi:single-stranded-DNA-specific exonuclease
MKCQLVNPNFKENYLTNILTHRGVTDIEAFLNPNEIYLQEPEYLDNMAAGAQLLVETLKKGGNIFTIADCDVDGATSFAIIYQYMHDICDQVNLDWEIHTGKQHGLSDFIDMIEDSDKAYDLVLITDAGSNDYEYIERLAAMGTKCLILDHHEADGPFSDNAIIINNQLSPRYKNKDLCGAGVTWQFCRYLDKYLGVAFANNYMDLAAFGIISDMMSMLSLENRFIVTEGLKKLNNPFMKSLFEKQSFSMKDKLNPTSVAFYMTPLCNAMIRSGTMPEKRRMYEAFIHGTELVPCNKRGCKGQMELLCIESARECTNAKAKQGRILDQAESLLEMKIVNHNLLDNKILVLRLDDEDDFPSEVNGLVAMRLAAKYKRPTLVGRVNDEGVMKGSIRNPSNSPVVSLKDFLLDSGMFEFVQGHANAAGYALPSKKLTDFHNFANNALETINFDEKYFEVNFERFAVDSDLPTIVNELGACEELWGQGNEVPKIHVTSINLTRGDVRVMGARQDTLKFEKNGISYIKFFAKEMIEEINNLFKTTDAICIDVVGEPSINEYMGYTNPQIMINAYQVSDSKYSF